MKRIEIDGQFYRMRRDKLVMIPDEWVNIVTTSCTIRHRRSKLTGSLRRSMKRDTKSKDASIITSLEKLKEYYAGET